MGSATDQRPVGQPAASRPARTVALWVLAVQCLLALSWALYVLFLPGMLAAAGIERRWLIYVLIADQLLFAVFDRIAGSRADRIAAAWRRFGGIIGAVTLLSSALLLAMPWVARSGQPVLLLGVIFVWAASTSALRAPVFALLGRIREATPGAGAGQPGYAPAIDRPGTIAIALVGIGLAGAIGPYLTLLLAGVDARLPIGLSAIGLAASGLWATRIERTLPRLGGPADADARAFETTRRRAWALAGVVLVAGFGTQVGTAIVGAPLFQRFVGADAAYWLATFWAGFTIGLVPGVRLAQRSGRHSLSAAGIALLVGCVGFAAGAQAARSLPTLVVCIAVAGGAWGAFSTLVFTSAVSLSAGRATTRGAGTASGLLFSAIALGTLLRLGCVALGFDRAAWMVWLPVAAWLVASALLALVIRTLWRETGGAAPS